MRLAYDPYVLNNFDPRIGVPAIIIAWLLWLYLVRRDMKKG